MLRTSECVAGTGAAMEQEEAEDAPEADEENDEYSSNTSFVQCFLNVTPIPYAKDGFVCVAVASCTQAKNADTNAENMYVLPEDLRLPENAQEWEDALSHIII